MRILYISYDGMLEPLGESQVVSYLVPLARHHSIALLSYEKAGDLRDRERVFQMETRLHRAGIRWFKVRYHKMPTLPATAWDLLMGILVGSFLCFSRKVSLVHARGYVASSIALTLKRLFGIWFLFDMRGFWADEKVEGGDWRWGSFLYHLAKRWERRFFLQADAVVSLTEEGVKAFPSLGFSMPPATPVEVIPTCVDLSKFYPGEKDQAALVIGCVGNLSGWYLRQDTLAYLAFLMGKFPRASVLFVTREDHFRLKADAISAGLPEKRVRLERANFDEMPDYLRLMGLGVFFIRPCFSKKASAATKLAEFLATGVPVVINDGIGDSGGIVREGKVGVVLPNLARPFFEESFLEVRELLEDPDCSTRCRAAAKEIFDLEEGVGKYSALYQRIAEPLAWKKPTELLMEAAR